MVNAMALNSSLTDLDEAILWFVFIPIAYI